MKFEYEVLLGIGAPGKTPVLEWHQHSRRMAGGNGYAGNDLLTILNSLGEDGWEVVGQGNFGRIGMKVDRIATCR